MRWSKGNLPDEFKPLHGDDRDFALSVANGVFKRDGDEQAAVRTALVKVEERNMAEAAREDEAKEPKLFDEDLSFSVSLSEAVEGDDGVVRAPAVLIEAGWSKNGRYYSPALLAANASRYEGAGSFAGHIRNPTPADYVAVHEGVGFDRGVGAAGALTSTYKIFDTKLGQVARHAPHLIQLSINDKGRIRRGKADGREGFIVEELRDVRPTCDAVVNAGARGGIGAVLEAFEEDKMEIKSIQDLKEAFPEYVKTIAEEARDAALATIQEEGTLKELTESLEETKSELTKVSAERDEALHRIEVLESRGILDEKLGEADLPEKLEARIREQFQDIKVEADAVDAAIGVVRELLADVKEAAKVDDVKEDPEDIQEQAKDRKEKDLELLRRAGLLDGDE